MAERRSGLAAPRPVSRVRAGVVEAGNDDVAVEEPLEIRVNGDAFAVTMRTPGHDAELALGLLFGEGVVRSRADVGSVAHCGRPGDDGYGNVIDVVAAAGVALDPDAVASGRRALVTTAACGVCGRASIEDLLGRIPSARASSVVVTDALVHAAFDALDVRQQGFASTGGLHAALAVTASGAILRSAEDVGRHNALDKVIGGLVRDGLVGGPEGARAEPPGVLAVTSRVGFEIVQKAAVARVPVIAGIGAATTLAIDLAQAAGITLIAFARRDRLSAYTHPERVRVA